MKTKIWIIILALTFLFSVVALRTSAQEVVPAERAPRFQRYAYLSEAENDLSERWFRKDKVLWTWLFVGGDKNFTVSKEQAERMEAWRAENPKIFRVMLNKAWTEVIQKQEVISL